MKLGTLNQSTVSLLLYHILRIFLRNYIPGTLTCHFRLYSRKMCGNNCQLFLKLNGNSERSPNFGWILVNLLYPIIGCIIKAKFLIYFRNR